MSPRATLVSALLGVSMVVAGKMLDSDALLISGAITAGLAVLFSTEIGSGDEEED